MNDTMRDLLSGAPGVRYSVGGGFTGWTSLSVGATGEYDLRSTMAEGGAEHRFTGQLPPDRVAGLVTLLRDLRIWEVEHVRKRAPGETAARIEVSAGERSAAVELWTGEVRRVAAFQQATTAIVALVSELSGGLVEEPGR